MLFSAICPQRYPIGAGGGGRTRTVSLPPDFESGTSANSITPANRDAREIIYQFHRLFKSFFKKIKLALDNYASFIYNITAQSKARWSSG